MMKERKITKITMMVIVCILIAVASSSAQENYPNKPIQIIIPYSAGGSLDLFCRMLAEKFREYLGQPVLVVNKPGATGAIAASYVATSKPDGYNLYASSGASFGFLHVMNPTFAYRLNDFTAVGAFARFPQVIVVHKDLPVKTVAELVAYTKKNPGTLSYGSSGYGGGDHLAFEAFKLAANVPLGEIQHVPYPGVAPVITALLGNQVQVGMCPFSALIVKQIESGTLRALAVLSPKRFPFRPEIPTIAEAGYPQLVTLFYLSFWAPAKTPAPVVKKLENATKRVTEDKEVREKIEAMYHEVEFLNSQDLQKYAEEQVSKWGAFIKKLGIVIK
jgi:tripartite-type tricarboxylate transporter receptor subunit TctC